MFLDIFPLYCIATVDFLIKWSRYDQVQTLSFNLRGFTKAFQKLFRIFTSIIRSTVSWEHCGYENMFAEVCSACEGFTFLQRSGQQRSSLEKLLWVWLHQQSRFS